MSQSLGTFIRERRQDLGLTQEALADRIGGPVRQAEISRLEGDRITLPRRERLEAIAAALDVSLGELLVRSGWMQECDRRPVALDALRGDGWAGEEVEALASKNVTTLLELMTAVETTVAAAAASLAQTQETVGLLRDMITQMQSPRAAIGAKVGVLYRWETNAPVVA